MRVEACSREGEIHVLVIRLVVIKGLALVDEVEVVIRSQLLPDMRDSRVRIDIGIEAVISKMFRYSDDAKVFMHAGRLPADDALEERGDLIVGPELVVFG